MSKKRWNRCVSLLVSAVMLASIIAGTDITAVAAATEVQGVDLTISPELLLAGAIYSEADYDKSKVTASMGNCIVESVVWNDAGGNPLTDGARLEEGRYYRVSITLAAATPDQFAPDATVTINGEVLADNQYVNRYVHSDYDKLEIDWEFQPSVKHHIESINLTGAPVATAGNTADTYNYTHNEAGLDQYTVTGTWYEYDASAQEYKSMASNDIFRADGAYRLTLRFKAELGYVFENLNFMVNGDWVNPDDSDAFEGSVNLYYSFGTEITEVKFTVSKPVEGQNFSNTTPIRATVPSGSNYTVEGNWRDAEGNFTGTFATGKEYYFESKIYAGDGYYFARDVEVYVNDTDFHWGIGTGKIMPYSYRSSLRIPIDEVILNNVPKAELGKPLQSGEFSIEVPADAKYEVKAQWYDETGALVTNGTAEAGKSYFLEITIEADSEYEFAEPYILRINGIAHQRIGGYYNDLYHMEYSFLEKIRHIEVTGVVDPVVGQTPSTDTLKSAEPTKYEITSAEWIDAADGSPATKFENGHAYELLVTVEAKPGYEFAPYASWTMSGEDGVTVPTAVPRWTLNKRYSFETIIPEVQVNNIPTMELGKTARTDISTPAGTDYTVEAEWVVWNENKAKFETFSGKFEQGKTYRLMIRAWSNPGYRFEKDLTACYIDGVLKDIVIDDFLAYYGIDFAEQGAQVIQKVEFNIKKPVAGEHSSIGPVLTVSKNANYHQSQNGFSEWIVGDIQQPWNFDGYFEEGGNYGVRFNIVANEGYVFAKDLVVVVNGVVLPAEAYAVRNVKEMDGNYFFNMTNQHVPNNGTDAPQTGDNSYASPWFFLLFLSGVGVFGLTLNERKRKLNSTV